jgi:hypothetical protein
MSELDATGYAVYATVLFSIGMVVGYVARTVIR